MTENIRSRLVTEGIQRAPNRAMLRAVGFGDGDFAKPIIGLGRAYSTIIPCHAGLDTRARGAETAYLEAGAMPQLCGTITVSDGIVIGNEPLRLTLRPACSSLIFPRRSWCVGAPPGIRQRRAIRVVSWPSTPGWSPAVAWGRLPISPQARR